MIKDLPYFFEMYLKRNENFNENVTRALLLRTPWYISVNYIWISLMKRFKCPIYGVNYYQVVCEVQLT